MTNSNATAVLDNAPADRRRRFPRKTIVGIVVLGLVAVAGVAFALYVLTAKVNGTATTKTANYAWSASGVAGAGSAGTCTADVPSSGTNGNALTMNIVGYPGDTCTITGSLFTQGASEDFRVTGVSLTGLPTGWTVALGSGNCGKTITAGQATPVSFTVTIGATGTGTGTIGGGLSLSPVSQTGTGALTCAA